MMSYRFEDLTRGEIREVAPQSTVVIPLGSTEQHGPHLPVSVDTLIISALAKRAVEQAAQSVPVLLAPTLPFGFAHHHLPYSGTISTELHVYLDVITGIGRSLVADGFERILFLNGHGGNDASVRMVGDRLVFELGLNVHVGGASYWSCAREVLDDLPLNVGPIPGHAGGFETSCVLALQPELVRREQMAAPEKELQPLARMQFAGATIRRPEAWAISDGRTDDARNASKEKGEMILDAVSERLAGFIVEFHNGSR